jgi:hypothetical protein
MLRARTLRWLCAALLGGFSLPGLPQNGSTNPLPLTVAAELKLTGLQRFRVGIVANNSGDFPKGSGRLATLVGDGTVVPVAGGFFWHVVIRRSQVDGNTIADKVPLMEFEMLTDAQGAPLGQETRISPRVVNDENARPHVFHLTAVALWLERGIAMLLPDGPVRTGSPLGSMRPAIDGLLGFMAPGVRLREPPPPLLVEGRHVVQGRPSVRAAGRGSLDIDSPLGAVVVQQEAQADIALDSGLPLSTYMKLMGDLPGGLGRMDFSVRATLRTY